MTKSTYEDRVAAQISQYAETVNMHDLPDIFHVWSHNYILPGLSQVFETSTIDDAYALSYIEAMKTSPSGKGRILSIGCGDGGVEIRVAKILLSLEITDFKILCADLSPILLDRLRLSVEADHLEEYFEPIQIDLNRIHIPGPFDVIMANHSLHHIEELESLFNFIHQHLRDGGIFATCDVIGRNGHMRWPEAAAVVNAFWPLTTEKQKIHVLLQRYSEQFSDHDCSSEGFEGIRAQDILSLILERFHPYKFFGSGGIADMFVDRGYGHGFNAKDDWDVRFIHCVSTINEILLDAGVVTPTWMLAYFTKDDRGETYYRNRRALDSVRNTDRDPDWVRYYCPPGAPSADGLPMPPGKMRHCSSTPGELLTANETSETALSEAQAELATARARLSDQARQLKMAREALRGRDDRIDAALKELHARDMQIRALYSSTSWRLMLPFRVLVMLARRDISAPELLKRVKAKLSGLRRKLRR